MDALIANFAEILFFCVAALTVAGALGVIAFRSPVHAALSLLFCFLMVAVLFVLRHAELLAAVQVLAFDSGTAARGAVLSVAYSLGLGLPFLVFAAVYGRAAGVSRWLRRHMRVIQRVGAVVLIALGVALVTGLWSEAMASIQGWVSGFEVPL